MVDLEIQEGKPCVGNLHLRLFSHVLCPHSLFICTGGHKMALAAEHYITALREHMSEFLLRYEEDLYFHHQTDVPRDIAWLMYGSFRYCPKCGHKLGDGKHWMRHECE